MSLNFSVTNVADYRRVTTDPHPCPHTGKARWHPVTETLVWYSIPCGTPEITAKNVEEVWRRVKVWEQACGPGINGADGSVYLTRGDVLAHVGLVTNATSKTPTEFNRSLVETLFRRHVDQLESALDIIGVPDIG